MLLHRHTHRTSHVTPSTSRASYTMCCASLLHFQYQSFVLSVCTSQLLTQMILFAPLLAACLSHIVTQNQFKMAGACTPWTPAGAHPPTTSSFPAYLLTFPIRIHNEKARRAVLGRGCEFDSILARCFARRSFHDFTITEMGKSGGMCSVP